MFLHHLLHCSAQPGQPCLVPGSSPPAICWDDRSFSRVIPAAGNNGTESVPQPWQRSLAQGDDANPALRALSTSLPGWETRMGSWSCPWHGAWLSRGLVQCCSNLDQEWPAESFRGADLLGGGMWFRAELLALGGKTTAKGLETTVKGKRAGWGTRSPWWPGIRDSHQISSHVASRRQVGSLPLSKRWTENQDFHKSETEDPAAAWGNCCCYPFHC